MNFHLFILKKLKPERMLRNSKPIIVIAGDIKSVFLEIYFKSLKKSFSRPLILLVDKKVLEKQKKDLNFNFALNEILQEEINNKKLDNKKLNFINIRKKRSEKEYISDCFNTYFNILKTNSDLPLINGPINKSKFLKSKYFGITEYIGDKFNKKKEVVMLIYNKFLSVSPLTTHIPLKDVKKSISKKKIINHVKKINLFFKKYLNIKPKIAVTGLNPHCESNFKSSEEKNIILPALKLLNKQGFNVAGPFSADTIFLKQNYIKYNVIIGMYHDQVLSPIKSIFGFKAINITLGLPILRLSPDHGPNVKMFGKNISNPDSLIEALYFLNK